MQPWNVLAALVVLALLAGCKAPRQSTSTPAAVTQPPVASVETGASGQPSRPPTAASDTAIPTLPPTATPLPAAAVVNGLSIPLAEFEAGLLQLQSTNSAELTAEDRRQVLDDLVDQELLAQGARQQGYTVGEAELGERLQALEAARGGPDGLEAWMSENGYTRAVFQEALRRSIAAAWMRDRLGAAVSATAEQIHVRQILLYNAGTANEIMDQIRAGNDFGNLAVKYDPTTRGDLGWFPRGYLLDLKLEEAAFALQPDGVSEVIQTLAGYHILQLIERQADRPLSPEARLILQTQAVQRWLQDRRANAAIEVLTP